MCPSQIQNTYGVRNLFANVGFGCILFVVLRLKQRLPLVVNQGRRAALT